MGVLGVYSRLCFDDSDRNSFSIQNKWWVGRGRRRWSGLCEYGRRYGGDESDLGKKRRITMIN